MSDSPVFGPPPQVQLGVPEFVITLPQLQEAIKALCTPTLEAERALNALGITMGYPPHEPDGESE